MGLHPRGGWILNAQTCCLLHLAYLCPLFYFAKDAKGRVRSRFAQSQTVSRVNCRTSPSMLRSRDLLAFQDLIGSVGKAICSVWIIGLVIYHFIFVLE